MRYLISIIAVVLAATAAVPDTYYMAPPVTSGGIGDDTADGDTESAPWASFTYALGVNGINSGDTLIVMDGEWSGGDEPWGVGMHAECSGTPGDWTYVIADTGATPIFDATGQVTETWAIELNSTGDEERIVFQGLTFQDYPDADDCPSGYPCSGENGTSNATGTLRFKTYSGGTITGFHVIDCTFEGEDADTVDGGIVQFSNNAEPTPGFADSILISGCRFTQMGNVAVTLYAPRHSIIEGCYFSRPQEYTYHRTQFDGPNAINILRHAAENITIRDCEISGFDHGVEVKGNGGLFERNYIHDTSDDFLWLHENLSTAVMGRRGTRDWVVRDNLFAWCPDDGLEVQGASHEIYHNTFMRVGDWLINMSEDTTCEGSTCDADSNLVEGNLFIMSQPGADGGPGNRGTQLQPGHSNNIIRNNIYFDPDGALTFQDQDDVGVTDMASFNAKSYASGNLEVDPVLADTTIAASEPYAAGYTLSPLLTSPALGLGRGGRTAGAVPCFECPMFSLSVTGVDPDSVHLEWREASGALGGFRYNGGSREWLDNVWLADVDHDEQSPGALHGTWTVFRNGVANDSVSVYETVTPPARRVWSIQGGR